MEQLLQIAIDNPIVASGIVGVVICFLSIVLGTSAARAYLRKRDHASMMRRIRESASFNNDHKQQPI